MVFQRDSKPKKIPKKAQAIAAFTILSIILIASLVYLSRATEWKNPRPLSQRPDNRAESTSSSEKAKELTVNHPINTKTEPKDVNPKDVNPKNDSQPQNQPNLNQQSVPDSNLTTSFDKTETEAEEVVTDNSDQKVNGIVKSLDSKEGSKNAHEDAKDYSGITVSPLSSEESSHDGQQSFADDSERETLKPLNVEKDSSATTQEVVTLNANKELFESNKRDFVSSTLKAFQANFGEYNKLLSDFAPLKELFDKILEGDKAFDDRDNPKMCSNAADFISACFKLEYNLETYNKLLTEACVEGPLKYKATAQNWLSWLKGLKIEKAEIDSKYSWMWFEDLTKAKEWCISTTSHVLYTEKEMDPKFGNLVDLLKSIKAEAKISVFPPKNKSECTLEFFKELVTELKSKDDYENLEKVIRSFISIGLGDYLKESQNIHLQVAGLKFFQQVIKE